MLEITYNDMIGCKIYLDNSILDSMPRNKSLDTVVIKDTYNPEKFEQMIQQLIKSQLSFETLILENNHFVGNGFCDPLLKAINGIKIKHVILLEDTPILTDADRYKLSTSIFQHAVKIELPDSVTTILKRPQYELMSRGSIPSHYTLARKRLMRFLSLQTQQRRDYTCAPAGILMIQNFYHNLFHVLKDSNSKTKVDVVYLRQRTEFSLSKLFKTSDSEGTDLYVMGNALFKQGYPVIAGFAARNNIPSAKEIKKQLLIEFKTLINEGIPILVNILAKDYTGKILGHYCLISNFSDNGDVHVSDPGAIYFGHGKLEQRIIARNEFLKSWISEDGIPGGYLILFPNKTKQYELLEKMPTIQIHDVIS